VWLQAEPVYQTLCIVLSCVRLPHTLFWMLDPFGIAGSPAGASNQGPLRRCLQQLCAGEAGSCRNSSCLPEQLLPSSLASPLCRLTPCDLDHLIGACIPAAYLTAALFMATCPFLLTCHNDKRSSLLFALNLCCKPTVDLQAPTSRSQGAGPPSHTPPPPPPPDAPEVPPPMPPPPDLSDSEEGGNLQVGNYLVTRGC
jgi:hypothetical protein